MFTCSKLYPEIPFAHRQHRHPGHCAQIHGHNWSFRFTFGSGELDACGFVVDFGSLGYIRDWLRDTFDHACCFNRDDAVGLALARQAPELFKVVEVDCCSAEGLARHTWETVNPMVAEATGGRVRVVAVEVFEDQRNAARYEP